MDNFIFALIIVIVVLSFVLIFCRKKDPFISEAGDRTDPPTRLYKNMDIRYNPYQKKEYENDEELLAEEPDSVFLKKLITELPEKDKFIGHLTQKGLNETENDNKILVKGNYMGNTFVFDDMFGRVKGRNKVKKNSINMNVKKEVTTDGYS